MSANSQNLLNSAKFNENHSFKRRNDSINGNRSPRIQLPQRKESDNSSGSVQEDTALKK
jgi:hypothetical protein